MALRRRVTANPVQRQASRTGLDRVVPLSARATPQLAKIRDRS